MQHATCKLSCPRMMNETLNTILEMRPNVLGQTQITIILPQRVDTVPFSYPDFLDSVWCLMTPRLVST